VGILSLDAPGPSVLSDAFRKGLREAGHIEGKDVVLDWRFADGNTDRLRMFASELVALRVDVIVTVNTTAAEAAKQATSTIPIVAVRVADPVGSGLVASLARPGGNLTGLVSSPPDLSAKRLQLLKEVIPRLKRVAMLWDSRNKGGEVQVREAAGISPKLGLTFQDVSAEGPDHLRSSIDAALKARAGALITVDDVTTMTNRQWILDLANRYRLPVMSVYREMPEAGALMSYGPNAAAMYRRAAALVGKVLKGAHPADLPVEQPTTFELVINLKTAKALGITIPQSILVRADKVIE